MAIQVADACLWLLIAVFLPAAAEEQSHLVCTQTPALVKAGLREGAAISCRLVNFNYTNSTYVIWSFVSRSSTGDNVVVLRGGQRKSYYQAIHSDRFPTLDIERITADTLLYPLYNVTVIQEGVQVLKTEFSLTAVGMKTTSKSPTLIPSSFESREPTVSTSPSPISQTSAASRIVPSIGTEITVPTITQTKTSTFSANYRSAGVDYAAAQSTSRVLTNSQGRTSPPLTVADLGSTDQPSFQCNQFPSIATVGVGKDVAITCRLNAAKWTNESYVSWTFNARSPNYGYRGVTLKDGERMYALEAIKDVKFPTLFISRVTESLLAFPDFRVTFYNGTNEVLSTVYTTRIQGVSSQSTQPSSSSESSMSTTASATSISSDWHSTHFDTDLARSRESGADTTSHWSSSPATVASTSLTKAATMSDKTVSLLSTNVLASETKSFMASSPGPDSSALSATTSQPAKTSGFFSTSAATVDMPRSIQITSEKLSSSGVSMFSVTERINPTSTISSSTTPSVTGGSTREDMRTMADSTAATTKSVLSVLSSYAPTQDIPPLSSSSGVTASPRATNVFSLFSVEATAPSTRSFEVRTSEPELATFSQATATAASLTATIASSSAAPTKDPASAVSTSFLPQNSSVTSSIRNDTVESLPITTKLIVILETSSATAGQLLSTEAGTASPKSPTVLLSSESAASATIADATLSRQTTSWPYASLTSEKPMNLTLLSVPHQDTVDGGLQQTMTNSAAPTVATAAITRLTAAGNSSVAMPTSMSAEGTPQGELPKASTLTAASSLIVTLPPLSSAQSLPSSASYTAVNSGVTSTLSSGVESLTNSAAVRTESTSGTQVPYSSSSMHSAALNLTRSTATMNFFGSSSTIVTEETLVKSSTTTYSGTPQGSKTDTTSREMVPNGTIPILTSASNVPAASSYAALSASASLPTSPRAVSVSQTVAPSSAASDSRTLTEGVLPGDSISIDMATKGSSSGPASQKPSTIETQSTKRVLSTLRQSTRRITFPQDDYASGASSCFLSHAALLILLLTLL